MSSTPLAPEVKLKMSYLHNPGSEPLLGMTIGDLVDQAAHRNPNVEAIVDIPQGIRKTFAHVRNEADQLAAGFIAAGLQRGDRIGILGPNSYEWYLTFLAAARMGLIAVTINFTFQAMELKYCLTKVGVKALVCAESFRRSNFYDLLLKVAPDIKNFNPGHTNSILLPSFKCLIMMSKKFYPGAFSFGEVMEMGTYEDVDKLHKIKQMVQFDDPSNIQYTSGTTGLPKATVLTHHSIVNNVYFAVQRTQGISRCNEDKYCVTVPFFHAYGCVGLIIGSLHTGGTCVLPSPVFNPSAVLKAVEEERLTHMFGTPTMYVDLLRCLEKEPRDVSSIRKASIGAAPSSKELLDMVKRTFGIARTGNAYGQTEATLGVMSAFDGDPPESLTSTVGFPFQHTEVKVVDKNGHVVPVGQSGELCVRGYMTMLGYWGDPEKTREALKEDRWLRTGDLFILQENGYGRIVGRVKDMIIRGGENVFPKEIEDFIMTHPKVLDVNVVGVPDPRLGEDVCAFIRLKDGEKLTNEELRSYCTGKMAYYKIPRYVLCVKDFPKTASGKVQKFALVQEAAKLLNLPSKL